MTLTIDVKDNGVLTLLRDMERLDLLHVTTPAAVSPAPVPAKSAARDRELFELHAEELNAEALDVLLYQSIEL
jgi:hypothetical protein